MLPVFGRRDVSDTHFGSSTLSFYLFLDLQCIAAGNRWIILDPVNDEVEAFLCESKGDAPSDSP
jgi:hypothetical protein